ncbi:MAG: formate dehydrogenase subunit gamma [Hyphomicrobiales bacterium]|nr:formate dehydrogenase subunit gamma [Hyphomicrobiales bacterium]
MLSPQIHDSYPVAVDRYSGLTRLNHWINAFFFVALVLSGLAFYSPYTYFLSGLFGGGANARMLHPWFGVIVTISFLFLFFRFVGGNGWKPRDTAWMKNPGAVLSGDEEALPEAGKYNAGQKIVFWSMTMLIIIMIATGLVIWDQYFAAYTSIEVKRAAVLIHSVAATAAIIVLIIHIYAAIWVWGSIGAMTSGRVTGGWAWRHHRKWLRDLVAGRVDGDMPKA